VIQDADTGITVSVPMNQGGAVHRASHFSMAPELLAITEAG